MRDKSNQLLVVNTGRRKLGPDTDNQATRKTGGSGGGVVGGSQYLLKEIWDKCWEIRTTDQGEEYIFGKLPVAVQYGLTSYVDVGNLELPDIYDGLNIDNQTLYWEKTTEETTDEEGNVVTKVVKVLKSKGGGSAEGTIKDVVVNGLGNAITNVELSADKKALLFDKGLTFAERKYVDDTFVTLGSPNQTITSEKNFTGGLLVNGNEIVWDERGFWKLDGDLLVTGGITSFADNTKYTPSTVMNALVLDNQTLDINEYGQLFVKNGGGANVEIVESLPSDGYKENTLYVVVQ